MIFIPDGCSAHGTIHVASETGGSPNGFSHNNILFGEFIKFFRNVNIDRRFFLASNDKKKNEKENEKEEEVFLKFSQLVVRKERW